MTSRDARTHLWHVLAAIESIRRFTIGYDRERYRADEVMRSAVERQFLIIGEALGRLRRTDAALAAEVQALRHAVAFRNLLAHQYDTVDDDAVWAVVEAHLPGLADEVSAVLSRLG